MSMTDAKYIMAGAIILIGFIIMLISALWKWGPIAGIFGGIVIALYGAYWAGKSES